MFQNFAHFINFKTLDWFEWERGKLKPELEERKVDGKRWVISDQGSTDCQIRSPRRLTKKYFLVPRRPTFESMDPWVTLHQQVKSDASQNDKKSYLERHVDDNRQFHIFLRRFELYHQIYPIGYFSQVLGHFWKIILKHSRWKNIFQKVCFARVSNSRLRGTRVLC